MDLSSKLNRHAGFTAIEVILILVMLGILAAIAYPRMQALPGIRVSAAAQTIVSDINYAQTLAITMPPDNYGVVFTAGTNSYSVYKNSAGTIIPHPFKPGNYTVNLNVEYQGAALGSNYTVEFDSLGSPVSGGGGSVTVSGGGSSKTIAVQANTGRVTVN
jgi:type II secretory pathway pseudopilin PulG